MSVYTKPQWSALPSTLYTLEVLKDGVSLEEIGLEGKESFLLGRGEDCDIVLAHPSISRHHAVLQHNSSGDLFLFDLGSSHGSSVNGQIVEPKTFSQVFTGDVLKFAGSTRTYVVNGPDEKQRPHTQKMFSDEGHLLVAPKSRPPAPDLQATRHLLEAQQRRQESYEQEMKSKLQEVSWGFTEDAKELAINPQDKILYEDVLDLDQVRMRGDVTERHLKQIEVIEEKRRKLEGLKREIASLTRKEDEQEEGLTKGQSHRLSTAQERLSDLTQEVEIEEENLRNMFLDPIPSSKSHFTQESSSDDEYFDRVAKKRKTAAVDSTLSFESALMQYQETVHNREKLAQMLAGINDSKDGDEEDEFEAFMRENREAMDAANRAAIAGQMKELNAKIDTLHATLAKLDPARFTDYIRESDRQTQRCKPQPPPNPPAIDAKPSDPQPAEIAAKPQKFTVASKPLPRNVQEDFAASAEELEAALGRSDAPDYVKKATAAKMQWQPPKDQTGDGRTALNDKFRY